VVPPPLRVSCATSLASLPINQWQAILASKTPAEILELRHDWRFWARPEQLPPPGDWRVWLYLAGRGSGKTRSGAEWTRAQVAAGRRRIALVAPTAADARDVIVEGESGILAVSPPLDRPVYEPSKRRITWPNGAIATTYSADEPERLRGPQHDCAWCDELGAWRYPEAWDMLMFGLRLGDDPRIMVTTTPRPTKLIKDLVSDPTVAISRGSTYENRKNLAGAFLQQIVKKYEGTRLGRQELNAELLDDVPGALWNRALLEAARPPIGFVLPDLVRVVVAIDPAASSGEDSDETGIIVAGKDKHSRGYVLADLSGRYTPIEWARIAVAAYKAHGADRIVAEVNNGGEMVEATLRVVDDNVAYTAVHATRGKVVRAEPVSALYEQGRIRHMGAFTALEDQMCEFTPDLDRSKPKRDPMDPSSLGMGGARSSPDRADALVWAFTEILVEEIASWGIYEVTRRKAEALVKERLAAVEAGRPKSEPAPGSMEYQALHPEWVWKPSED
jgi:phage terminase large subunit-like protein